MTALRPQLEGRQRKAVIVEKVEFWFDPSCPWAWMTSRWMGEVEQQRDIEIKWNILSLGVINEGKELPEAYRAHINATWGPARVLVAVEAEHGPQWVKPLYDAMGVRFHPGGRRDIDNPAVIAESLAEVGLPAELAQAAETDKYDQLMRESTARAQELVGNDVGVPVIALAGTAFFGPVVTPAPRGEAAAKLWDGCLLVAQTPGFYELKRSRDQGPIFD